MGIGNIGWTEFIVILAIALIFFGPRRLPGIAQAIGKSLREFQKALNEVKSEIAQASKEADTTPDLKRIAPHPADFITPEPETTKEAESPVSPPAPEAPAAKTGGAEDETGAPGDSQDPSPDKTKAQHGDS
jgi:Tat protein translocase TatB subunit